MKKIYLVLGMHNHQPVGNFDFVFEDAYNRAYLPFLELLERHPEIRIAQHYTGILFEWIKQHKPEFIARLKRLVGAGQIEMMTGGYYEPIISVIPYRDKIGQVKKLSQFVRENIGYEPEGMWLAERIWEPHLPKPISEAGVKYVVLDDSHFKGAGLSEDELHGYYITEEEGYSVYLFPICEMLRYTIPFQPPEKTIEYLRTIASADRDTLVVFADDGEKFGIWPETYEHCYQNGWLSNFFQALEANSDWIEIIHFSEVLKKVKPLGRIYLPTASYREMMEWAMPTPAIHAYEQFEALLKKQALHEQYKVFIRGGFWRNFMVKYPEANNMHKKMLDVSRRLAQVEDEQGKTEVYKKAQDHVWASQCNCPYWHGVFGGLYLNHLRYATYHQLIQAERIVDDLHWPQGKYLVHETYDYDGDGIDEVVIRNPLMNLYFSPHSGGCLFELDYKPKAINLLDTMTRREEAYHHKLLETTDDSDNQHQSEVKSIHDMVVLKEEGLAERIFFDWHRRTSLLDHFLDEATTLENFSQSRYHELGDFVNGHFDYAVEESPEALRVKFWRVGQVRCLGGASKIELQKVISITDASSELTIDYQIKNLDGRRQHFLFGSEFDFALLAGDAPDRFYKIPGHELDDSRLCSVGETHTVGEIQLLDEWLRLEVSLRFDEAATMWRFPIETVSQSEGGFERVYQSSVVFPNWKFQLDPNETWTTRVLLKITSLN